MTRFLVCSLACLASMTREHVRDDHLTVIENLLVTSICLSSDIMSKYSYHLFTQASYHSTTSEQLCIVSSDFLRWFGFLESMQLPSQRMILSLLNSGICPSACRWSGFLVWAAKAGMLCVCFRHCDRRSRLPSKLRTSVGPIFWLGTTSNTIAPSPSKVSVEFILIDPKSVLPSEQRVKL